MIRTVFVVGDLISGGVKSYLTGYIRGLRLPERSFDVVAYSGADPKIVSQIEQLGGSVIEVPHISHPISYMKNIFMVYKSGNYDIAHGMLNTLNPFALIPAHFAGIKVRIAENLSTGHPLEKKNFFKTILKPFAKMGSTHIAANSMLAARWLFGNDAINCAILPNPIDLSFWTPDAVERNKVREKIQADDAIVIGWIGRYVPQKNPLLLIRLLKVILEKGCKAKLLMVGSGHLEKEVNAEIDRLGVGAHVIQIGATEEIRPYYRAMDLFILPSLYEGLPVVGIEAQAMGLPCIFSSEITDEVAINDNVTFLSLDTPLDEWADRVISIAGNFCLDDKNMRSSKSDQIDAAELMREFYSSAMKQVGADE